MASFYIRSDTANSQTFFRTFREAIKKKYSFCAFSPTYSIFAPENQFSCMNKHTFRLSALVVLFGLAQLFPDNLTAQSNPVTHLSGTTATPKVLLEEFRLSPFALLEEAVPVRFTLTNLSGENIKSLTLSFTVGEQSFETVLSDLDIPAGEHAVLTASCPGFTEELTEDFSFTVKDVNGEENFEAETKSSPTMRLHVRKERAPRLTLIEPFTSENCTNCPRVESMYKEFHDKYPGKVVVASHHCVILDSFTQDFSTALIPLLFSRNVPAWVVDRKNLSEYIEFYEPYNSKGPGLAAYKNEASEAVVDAAVKRPGEAFIQLKPIIDKEQRKVKVDVSGYLQRMVQPDSVRLTVYLGETHVEEVYQMGIPGNINDRPPFYHDYITRHCFTENWGNPIEKDGTFNASFELDEIPLYYNMDNLYVVAFVSNYDPFDNSKCEVYNAATVTLDSEFTSVTDLFNRTQQPTLHDGIITLPTGFTNLTLYRVDGTTVLQSTGAASIDMKAYPAGIYLISARTAEGLNKTYKIVNK